MPHLDSVAQAIALDLIGMGRSDKPDLEYRLADHVRYVEGFIEAFWLQRLTLVAHDLGSARRMFRNCYCMRRLALSCGRTRSSGTGTM